MKRKIITILLMIISIITLIMLYNQNNEIKLKNKESLSTLQEKDLVDNGKITLEKLKEEKESLENYAINTFKEDDIREKYNKNREINSSLTHDISQLEEQINNLENKIENLKNEYNKTFQEYKKPDTFYIKNVPLINQYPKYQTGCESVALTILLNYYGVGVTTDHIIEKLPKGARPYSKNGKLYGANPEVEFVGTPYSSHSFGVYEKPIATVANQYKSGINIATGTELDDILKIVSTNTPVLAWTSMNLIQPYISMSWIYEPTGERIYWKANEHAVVIIGYTKDQIIISDPIGGKVKYQSLSVFRDRYNYFGKKALFY